MGRKSPTLAVAMPMYNESDTILYTMEKIINACNEFDLVVVVQDDLSTDDGPTKLRTWCADQQVELLLESNLNNMRHGPTLMRAMDRAIKLNPDYLLQLDSDGQFQEADLVEMLKKVATDSRNSSEMQEFSMVAAHRKSRLDPWYRRTVTRVLSLAIVPLLVGERIPDPNSPLRLWRTDVLRRLLSQIPHEALVPNIMTYVLLRRFGLKEVLVEVEHTHRNSELGVYKGTMFSGQSKLVPRKFISFCVQSLKQFVAWERSIRNQKASIKK